MAVRYDPTSWPWYGLRAPHRKWAGTDCEVGFAWVATAVVASVLSILFLDRAAATWSHDVLRGAVLFRALTHIVDPIPLLAALGFLLMGTASARSHRVPRPILQSLLCACVAVLVAIAVKDQLKFAFGRLWPETWVNNNPSWIRDGAYGFAPFHGGTGWASFPSGHMTVITAPAAVFWHRHPAWRWLAVLPVALVAIGLYGADFHFVGDMIAGILLGAVCAAIVVSVLLNDFPVKVRPDENQAS